MPKPRTWTFDPAPLERLCDETGLSLDDVAAGCGISYSALMNYRKQTANPGVDVLMKIADFFAVPLDFLLGRCTLEESKAVLRSYSANFMLLRRASWEEYLRGRRPIPAHFIGESYEAPWPYNLLDAVGRPSWSPGHRENSEDNYWKDVVSEDQMRGLEVAMDSLAPREREALIVYFREGNNLEKAGQHFRVTRERARQIIAKGVRKLRHPSRSRLITLGVQGAALENENRKRRLALEAEAAELDAAENALLLMRDGLLSRAGVLSSAYQELLSAGSGPLSAALLMREDLLSMTVEEMEFSVRSYNCLKRAGINTLGDLVRRIGLGPDNSILRIRNLGRRSAEEIRDKVRVLTGEDYTTQIFGP